MQLAGINFGCFHCANSDAKSQFAKRIIKFASQATTSMSIIEGNPPP